jgi:hypothetical protein
MKFFPSSELPSIPTKEHSNGTSKHAAVGAGVGMLVFIVMACSDASMWWLLACPAGALVGLVIASGGRPPVMW